MEEYAPLLTVLSGDPLEGTNNAQRFPRKQTAAGHLSVRYRIYLTECKNMETQ